MNNPIDYRVYLVTDDPSRYPTDWLACVEAALSGGVTCVQYRDTESGGKVQYERAKALKRILDAYRIPLVINNDAGLALAVGAAGVHVGQNDLPPCAMRPYVGTRLEIGYSITHIRQLTDCAADVAASDCLGIGPVFDATKTKSDAAPEMGLQNLAAAVAASPCATVAIGGITLERAPEILRTGVGGLALVSAFSRAADPAQVARKIRAFYADKTVANQRTIPNP